MTAPDKLLVGYFARTQPVQWVGWSHQISDVPTQNALDSILFDEGGSLRDLTDTKIRESVLDCIVKHSALRSLVMAEAESMIVQAAAKIISHER